ncbi:G-type lectin S-receptor-like serine/threonine-protein kinase SD2-5 [Cryptomeria japonica]|uniref:G-type lectin S-receptor-like serine/threonine-protein kinase SD2-5 n=1 Tax=Cryptomeria japonica TaxID=3369 RepID=UPI0027DA3D5E|nr:G-type lectin S-receptor-like serine/threonine-protein kinase SD2-5 [Cryptomeria japonica]
MEDGFMPGVASVVPAPSPPLLEENVWEPPIVNAPYNEGNTLNANETVPDIPIHLVIDMENSLEKHVENLNNLVLHEGPIVLIMEYAKAHDVVHSLFEKGQIPITDVQDVFDTDMEMEDSGSAKPLVDPDYKLVEEDEKLVEQSMEDIKNNIKNLVDISKESMRNNMEGLEKINAMVAKYRFNPIDNVYPGDTNKKKELGGEDSPSFALSSATAYGGRTWVNNLQSGHFLAPSYYADALVRPILLTSNISYNDMNLQFGCGFFCYSRPCDTGYLFATFFVIYEDNGILADMQMVWSSNRDQMVQKNASLTLTTTGELMLKDSYGTLVWSTNTSSHDFQGMEIQESGSLVLFNTSGGIMWQSFDHPTDTVLSGQKFKVGQNLIANTSPTNTSQGIFHCSLSIRSFVMLIGLETPQIYYRYPDPPSSVELSYIQFDNESFYMPPLGKISMPNGCLYFKIDSYGHLQFYSIMKTIGRSTVEYLSTISNSLGLCDYPTPCGSYGVCRDGQCSCPKQGNYFVQIDATKPNLGCLLHRPLVCSNISRRSNCARGHHLLELEHTSYFTYSYNDPSIPQLVSRDYCKNLCLANCSCRAAFFRYGSNFSSGYCYLESNVYSLKMSTQNDVFYNSTAYIKVQSRPKQIKHLVIVIICTAIGGVSLLFLLLCTWISKRRESSKEKDEDEDKGADWPAGLPMRYSFQELQNATIEFSKKLGSGGFGSVYEGVLPNGSMIAVKRLDGAGQGEKEFKAEMETIGKIDHLNLVRLKGFCAEKAYRMLVYEHLPNGSLDRWIFSKNMLDWKTRYKVVLDIARGLTYLHEECREQIIHFDIKPHNILLDQHFIAKISDFGLAKLIDREQTEVITLLRGTPGYMAPELLNMHFTEKADVFSFGVVVVEIVSGKRSRDLSDNCLFSVLQVKAEEGRLIDLVYEGFVDAETSVREEAVKLIKVGMWCVQEDFTRRPAMSTVVKALEGIIDTMDDVPSSIAGFNPSYETEISYALLPSELSGPR